MSDTQSTRPSDSSSTTPSTTVDGDPTTGVAVLEEGKGTTTIADGVVSKLATLAAREVDGVSRMGDSVQGAIGGLVGRFRGEGHDTTGVEVEVGRTQVAVDLQIKVIYPEPVHKVAQQVREAIARRMTEMTGLDVVEVNVAVLDYDFPEDETDEGDGDGEDQQRETAPREGATY